MLQIKPQFFLNPINTRNISSKAKIKIKIKTKTIFNSIKIGIREGISIQKVPNFLINFDNLI